MILVIDSVKEFKLEYTNTAKSFLIVFPVIMVSLSLFLIVVRGNDFQGIALGCVSIFYGVIPFFRSKSILKYSEKIAILKFNGRVKEFDGREIYKTKDNVLQIGGLVVNLKVIKRPNELLEFLGPENIIDKRRN